MQQTEKVQLAEQVRKACLEAAQQGLELGGMSGLCAEGQLEMALDAIRALDLSQLITTPEP